MNKRIIYSSIAVASTLLFVVLSTSTPSQAGPIGVLFVFILIYIMLVACIMLALYGGSIARERFSKVLRTRKPMLRLSMSHSYYYASVLALVPVMLLAMQSVGQIDWRQFVLVAIFATVACVYVKKRIG